jgi:uncharacterized membrane protein YhiD involved in acid resistance
MDSRTKETLEKGYLIQEGAVGNALKAGAKEIGNMLTAGPRIANALVNKGLSKLTGDQQQPQQQPQQAQQAQAQPQQQATQQQAQQPTAASSPEQAQKENNEKIMKNCKEFKEFSKQTDNLLKVVQSNLKQIKDSKQQKAVLDLFTPIQKSLIDMQKNPIKLVTPIKAGEKALHIDQLYSSLEELYKKIPEQKKKEGE